MNSLIDSYCAKDSLVARPCSVCISPDRLAIDQYMLEGHGAAEIHRIHPGLAYHAIWKHKNNGHLSLEMAKKVSRAADISMDSVLSHVLKSRDRVDTHLDNGLPPQYAAPMIRVGVEADKLLSTVIVESTKLRLDREKLEQSKHSDSHSKLLRGLQFIKDHAPDLLQAYCRYVDQV